MRNGIESSPEYAQVPELCPSRSLVVVSNRLPVVLECGTHGTWSAMPASGGLVKALSPALCGLGGRWVGWCGIEEEQLARWNMDAQVLLDDAARYEQYDLEQVPLSRREIDEYYLGFSNQSLWPLFHGMPERAVFEDGFYNAYRNVNRKFARRLAESTSAEEFIWIHDYQLLTVATELRQARPKQTIGLFLHIPFPEPETLFRLPWHQELLKSMLAHDLVGFQTRRDVDHFLACGRELAHWTNVRRDGNRAVIGAPFRRVTVGVFPIGIDAGGIERGAQTPQVMDRVFRIRERFDHKRLVLGVDRLDYTKGIPQRLRGFRRVLREYRQLRGTVSLFQLVVPSRTTIPAYQEYKREIDRLVGEINDEFATTAWSPIHYQFRAVPIDELLALYRASDICLVTPLIDGMNLVCKEYCTSRTDEGGALILSRFAGAAEQLADGALLVDPHDETEIAEALMYGLTMHGFEWRRRMHAMRRAIQKSDVDTWMRHFLEAAGAAAVPQRNGYPHPLSNPKYQLGAYVENFSTFDGQS